MAVWVNEMRPLGCTTLGKVGVRLNNNNCDRCFVNMSTMVHLGVMVNGVNVTEISLT